MCLSGPAKKLESSVSAEIADVAFSWWSLVTSRVTEEAVALERTADALAFDVSQIQRRRQELRCVMVGLISSHPAGGGELNRRPARKARAGTTCKMGPIAAVAATG